MIRRFFIALSVLLVLFFHDFVYDLCSDIYLVISHIRLIDFFLVHAGRYNLVIIPNPVDIIVYQVYGNFSLLFYVLCIVLIIGGLSTVLLLHEPEKSWKIRALIAAASCMRTIGILIQRIRYGWIQYILYFLVSSVIIAIYVYQGNLPSRVLHALASYSHPLSLIESSSWEALALLVITSALFFVISFIFWVFWERDLQKNIRLINYFDSIRSCLYALPVIIILDFLVASPSPFQDLVILLFDDGSALLRFIIYHFESILIVTVIISITGWIISRHHITRIEEFVITKADGSKGEFTDLDDAVKNEIGRIRGLYFSVDPFREIASIACGDFRRFRMTEDPVLANISSISGSLKAGSILTIPIQLFTSLVSVFLSAPRISGHLSMQTASWQMYASYQDGWKSHSWRVTDTDVSEFYSPEHSSLPSKKPDIRQILKSISSLQDVGDLKIKVRILHEIIDNFQGKEKISVRDLLGTLLETWEVPDITISDASMNTPPLNTFLIKNQEIKLPVLMKKIAEYDGNDKKEIAIGDVTKKIMEICDPVTPDVKVSNLFTAIPSLILIDKSAPDDHARIAEILTAKILISLSDVGTPRWEAYISYNRGLFAYRQALREGNDTDEKVRHLISAVQDLYTAVRYDDTYALAYYNLGLVLYEMNRNRYYSLITSCFKHSFSCNSRFWEAEYARIIVDTHYLLKTKSNNMVLPEELLGSIQNIPALSQKDPVPDGSVKPNGTPSWTEILATCENLIQTNPHYPELSHWKAVIQCMTGSDGYEKTFRNAIHQYSREYLNSQMSTDLFAESDRCDGAYRSWIAHNYLMLAICRKCSACTIRTNAQQCNGTVCSSKTCDCIDRSVVTCIHTKGIPDICIIKENLKKETGTDSFSIDTCIDDIMKTPEGIAARTCYPDLSQQTLREIIKSLITMYIMDESLSSAAEDSLQ